MPRSRRFGKTLNLWMLRYFFEKRADGEDLSHLFADLAAAFGVLKSGVSKLPETTLGPELVRDHIRAAIIPSMKREVRIFSGHEAALEAQRAERSQMSKEERLTIGAELHAFWVRNYFLHATGLDRIVRVVQRSQR